MHLLAVHDATDHRQRLPVHLCVRRRQHQYVVPLTVPESHHISIHQLHISAGFNGITVEFRAVRRFQVNQIRFHFAGLVAVLVRASGVAKLDHRMLFGDAGMIEKNIGDHLIATK